MPSRQEPMTHAGAARTAVTRALARVPRRRDSGFSPQVRHAVRVRAGNGDPATALCEGCGRWLGYDGGQVQHRLARRAGGSRDPVIGTVMNALLLCGTPASGCHGAAESRSPRAWLAGLWLRSGDDIPAAAVRLYYLNPAAGISRTRRVFLLADGTYGTAPDRGAAA